MSFYELGKRLAGNSLGIDNREFDMRKQAADVCDVEHPDPTIREASTGFWRSFCHARASLEKRANGETQDYFLLKLLSEQPLWVGEFQKMAAVYADELVEGKELAEADELLKEASIFEGLAPWLAARAIGTVPETMAKTMIVSGIGAGMGAGSLYWGLNRAAREDSDNKLVGLQAKIDEYHKMKSMLQAQADDPFLAQEANLQKKINSL